MCFWFLRIMRIFVSHLKYCFLPDIREIEVSIANAQGNNDGRGISITDSAILITNYYYEQHKNDWHRIQVKPGDLFIRRNYYNIIDIKTYPSNTIAVIMVSVSTEIIQILYYVMYIER